MGTNYYFYEKEPCEYCGRHYDPIHIGKSSAGWAFGMHVDPDMGINNIDDWEERWEQPGSYIMNEYGEEITVNEMKDVIKNRTWEGGLYRHEIDNRHCCGHGEGTWDYILGEFE